MTDTTGSSLLTEGVPAAPAGGNPAYEPNSAQGAVQAVLDGPPEYIPAKFWDAEKKSAKTEEMGRSYQSLEKLLGREKIPVPASEDDDEGWQRW